jgi:CubicO group peptidase (beta-lactamase class C family)
LEHSGIQRHESRGDEGPARGRVRTHACHAASLLHCPTTSRASPQAQLYLKPFDRFARERIFDPLGIKDTAFRPSPEQLSRIATLYRVADGTLTRVDSKPIWMNSATYLSGGGGLMSSAEDYLQFGQMLANRGELNGKRLLGPKTVERMSSVFVPDTLPGRAKGRGFGLSVQVISDHIAANTPISDGSFGWDGAFGTHFWVDPKEKIVGLFMVQASGPNRSMNPDFENAVMQALIDPAVEHN